METAFNSQRDQYRYWVDAVALEGKWLIRKQTPTPDFILYFDSQLSKQWQTLADEMLIQLAQEFAILGNEDSDQNKVRACIDYVTNLEREIAAQNRAFLKDN